MRLAPDGQVRVQTAAHEIGTGAYTVIAQVAAETLGVPLDKVQVSWATATLPPAPVAGGSNTTASVCNVVMKACEQIRARLAAGGGRGRRAAEGPRPGRRSGSPTARCAAPDGPAEPICERRDGTRSAMARIEDYAENVPHGAAAGRDAPSSTRARPDRWAAAAARTIDGMSAFGAEFVEVRVQCPHARRSACRASSAPSRPAASSTRAPPAAS